MIEFNKQAVHFLHIFSLYICSFQWESIYNNLHWPYTRIHVYSIHVHRKCRVCENHINSYICTYWIGTLLIFNSITIVSTYLCDFVNASWSIVVHWVVQPAIEFANNARIFLRISNKIAIFSILWSDKLNALRWVAVVKPVHFFPGSAIANIVAHLSLSPSGGYKGNNVLLQWRVNLTIFRCHNNKPHNHADTYFSSHRWVSYLCKWMATGMHIVVIWPNQTDCIKACRYNAQRTRVVRGWRSVCTLRETLFIMIM